MRNVAELMKKAHEQKEKGIKSIAGKPVRALVRVGIVENVK